MTDLAWFPSAAMQTLGAMYALFVAIYVFIIKNVLDAPVGYDSKKRRAGLTNGAFILLSFIVWMTIALNAWALYRISIGSFFDLNIYTYCYLFFLVALTTIIIYAVTLVYDTIRYGMKFL
ncbi:MAG: hypothetical protein PHY36_04090 [Methanocellales archaeon]|nr:hypothetical protein [Methanocellales archaeon]